MNEKFVATLYQKIDLSENIIVFRRIGAIRDINIDLTDELNQAICYDSEKKRVILESMESEYTFVSDDGFCYGYPMPINTLWQMFPECKNEEELMQKYLEEISEVINIAYYDPEKDKMKILVTNEKSLKEQESEEIFKSFSITYESEGNETITINIDDLQKIENLIKKCDYETLEEEIESLSNTARQVVEFNQQENVQEEKKTEESVEEILNQLNQLTGLENIKEEINKLIKYLSFRTKTQKYLNIEQPNLHMFFTGNPGTGKTTVARILSKLFYRMGYVKKDTFAEITPKDLIAGYVGQTAIKTSEFLEKNRNGVIFVDEAYIFSGEAQNFGQEALVEILKELEKNKTIFIFAGYKDEMEKFMNMNPGLTSRIGYYLEYKDYTKEQLYDIFASKVQKKGFIVDEDLKNKILKSIEKAKENSNFGNGRYIDKLIDKIILEHSINTEKYKRKKELITLTSKDFNDEIEETLLFKQKIKKIGF